MPHNVAADAADRAPSTASAIGVAAPGAWPLRWTRAAVLAAAKAAPSCKASFMAFYKRPRTHAPPQHRAFRFWHAQAIRAYRLEALGDAHAIDGLRGRENEAFAARFCVASVGRGVQEA